MMAQRVVEMAKIRLREDRSEADLMSASETFQRDFLRNQPGFLRRELLRLDARNYLDLVHWQSSEHAAAIMEHASGSPACQAFFAVMEMDSTDPAEGVTHYESLATYN